MARIEDRPLLWSSYKTRRQCCILFRAQALHGPSCCVTLGRCHNLSLCLFPHLLNRNDFNNNNTAFAEAL